MSSAIDVSLDVDEKSTERMNFRLKPSIKSTIQEAARLSGMDVSIFTIHAAHQAALEMINSREYTRLSAEDHAAFFECLDNPPAPTDALRDAFKNHDRQVVSK